MVRLCVWSRNLVTEEAVSQCKMLRQKEKKSAITIYKWYTIRAIHGADPVSFNMVSRSESINYAFMRASNLFNLEQKHHLLV
jgi:hypothetical protein